MNCEEIEELSGAYVLGAISEEERRVVEEHLAQCPEAAHLVQELQAVVNILPLAAPQTEPSSQVKERVLAAIRADTTRKQLHFVPVPAADEPPAVPQYGVQRAYYRVMTAASALLLVLVLAMGAWNISLQQDVTKLASSNTSLQQQVAQLASSSHISTPVSYTIKGSAALPSASGQLTYIPSLNTTVLVMHNLPPTRGTQVYQGWLLQGKQPQSVGLFNVQNNTATLNFQGNITGFDTAAVSLEPGPLASKSAPQGKIVAEGTLS